MRHSRILGVGLIVIAAACGDSSEPEVLLDISDLPPGEVISMRSDGDAIEWIERTAGQLKRLDGSGNVETLVSENVAATGEQRGMLGHAVIDGRRFASWTVPGSERLVVAEVAPGTEPRVVWNSTSTQTRAISGHLEVLDGQLLLGLGDLTGWAIEHGSGALVLLDPDGDAGQEPVVLSDGWNNPFAFIVEPLTNGTSIITVADNAPDGEVERLASITVTDWVAQSIITTDLPAPERAPSAIVPLPDGRYGVCGWLDGEMRAYELTDDGFERAGTVGDCRSAATVTPDGITVAATDTSITATR